MPDGDHQMVNIALAGVKGGRVASKPGEASEPWSEEVRGALCIPVKDPLNNFGSIGKILHRIAAPSATCQGPNPFPS